MLLELYLILGFDDFVMLLFMAALDKVLGASEPFLGGGGGARFLPDGTKLLEMGGDFNLHILFFHCVHKG